LYPQNLTNSKNIESPSSKTFIKKGKDSFYIKNNFKIFLFLFCNFYLFIQQHSNGESNNGNKIQNEDKNKNEEEQNKEEDKDFRQFWSSIEIKQKNIEEENNTNKSPPQLTKIISSPPPHPLPPSRPTSSAEIKNLPSLLDLNLTPPPSSSIHPPPSSSVKPFSFFGGQFGNNVKTANYGQTQKQSSPIRPFFNICPETPINVQQQQQELLSKGERIINIL